MDRGLDIHAAAIQIGVSDDTLINWEQHHCGPVCTHGAKILAFLGYCPFEDPKNFRDELHLWRWKRGLSHRQAATVIGVDPCTWQSWEREDKKPSSKSLDILQRHGIGKSTVPHLSKDARHHSGLLKKVNSGATKSPRNS